MITYLLKSASCLALLLVFYHLVLEREKMHQFNRFYLLGSILFSFIAPLYIIYIEVPVEIIETPIVLNQNFIVATSTPVETALNYWNIALIISITISTILLIRFSFNLYKIYRKITGNTKIKLDKAVLVLVDDAISPHTFWNYIFINKHEYNSQKIEEELFTHELTHVTQRHTIDVLLIEALKIIFWFNPIFYFLKKSIQLNHEFIADEKVINSFKNISEYQYLLLNKAAWNNDYYLASNLNYSLTKKRLVMMTTQSSQTKIMLKKLAIVPLLVGFVFLFAQRVEAQEKASKKVVAEYNALAKKYNQQPQKTRVVKLKDVKRLEYLYRQLSNLQKKNAEPFPNCPPPPPPPSPKTGFIKAKNQTLYYVQNNKGTTYYNRWGQQVTKEGKVLNHKQTRSDKVIPGQNVHKVYKNDNVISEFKTAGVPPPPPPKSNFPEIKKGDITNIPPPPFPKSAKELIHEYPTAQFYFNGKKISRKKALRLVKNKKRLDISTNFKKDPKVIKFSTRNYVRKREKSNIPPPPKESSHIEEIQETQVMSTPGTIEVIEEVQETPEEVIEEVVETPEEVVEKIELKEIKKDTVPSTSKKHIKVKNKKTTYSKNGEERGWLYINNQTLFYLKKNGKTQYFNRWGYLVDRNGKVLNPNKKVNQKPVSIDKFNDLTNDEIIALSKKSSSSNPTYYLNGKLIEKEKVKKLDPNNIEKLNVVKDKNGNGSIYIISKK